MQMVWNGLMVVPSRKHLLCQLQTEANGGSVLRTVDGIYVDMGVVLQ